MSLYDFEIFANVLCACEWRVVGEKMYLVSVYQSLSLAKVNMYIAQH